MQPNFNIKEIKLIVGLGNPGKEYENTYHNVGFLFTDYITKNLPISNFKFLISKSDTPMNLSGGFVKKTLKKRGAKPDQLLIVHDDSDITLGKYKLAFGRGAAGHKGVESVIKALGTKSFWRLRIGIRPAGKRTKAETFVLKKISPKGKKILNESFESVSTALSRN